MHAMLPRHMWLGDVDVRTTFITTIHVNLHILTIHDTSHLHPRTYPSSVRSLYANIPSEKAGNIFTTHAPLFVHILAIAGGNGMDVRNRNILYLLD